MARKKKHPEHVNHERWLISYADFITLLFAFFVVMFAVSRVDSNKVGRFTESFSKAVGIEVLAQAGAGLLPADGTIVPRIAGSGDGDGSNQELQKLKEAIEGRAQTNDVLKSLEYIKVRNELVLRFPVGVVFDSGDDAVKPEAVAALLTIAKEVMARPLELRVEGHTDNRPIRTVRFRSNWDLSACRATAVVSELAKVSEIAPARLSAAGYGEYHPIASNDTAEGRAKNRRVDIVVRVAATSDPKKDDGPGIEEARGSEGSHAASESARAPSSSDAGADSGEAPVHEPSHAEGHAPAHDAPAVAHDAPPASHGTTHGSPHAEGHAPAHDEHGKGEHH